MKKNGKQKKESDTALICPSKISLEASSEVLHNVICSKRAVAAA